MVFSVLIISHSRVDSVFLFNPTSTIFKYVNLGPCMKYMVLLSVKAVEGMGMSPTTSNNM